MTAVLVVFVFSEVMDNQSFSFAFVVAMLEHARIPWGSETERNRMKALGANRIVVHSKDEWTKAMRKAFAAIPPLASIKGESATYHAFEDSLSKDLGWGELTATEFTNNNATTFIDFGQHRISNSNEARHILEALAKSEYLAMVEFCLRDTADIIDMMEVCLYAKDALGRSAIHIVRDLEKSDVWICTKKPVLRLELPVTATKYGVGGEVVLGTVPVTDIDPALLEWVRRFKRPDICKGHYLFGAEPHVCPCLTDL
jgi:hypothetical protein